ncbi:MAG TPA: DeoR/GlpR family DNA-binding transcription regulator [Pseudonocardia sp.]|nr:DeoR/GlpR family DNA-binding transcription regulator [Pseudonocardia sp.]
MQVAARREEIRRLLLEHGEVEFGALADRFGVSEMTVRRDLEALESDGVARRVRNGAIDVTGRAVEPPFGNRASVARAAKIAMAARAIELVAEDETVVLDSGTTVLELARLLRRRELALTVLTPSVLAAIEIAAIPGSRVILTGGTVRPGELSLIGPAAEEPFTELNCDVVFLSTAGLDLAHGLTDYNLEEARVKRAALCSARRSVALMDRSKLDRVYLANVLPLSSLDVLVTDADPAHPVLERAREIGIKVLTVTVTDSGTDGTGSGGTEQS